MFNIESSPATTTSIPEIYSGHLKNKTVFESEDILRSFFSSRRVMPEMELERRVAFAILADAVRCFQRNIGAQSRPKVREFAEAES